MNNYMKKILILAISLVTQCWAENIPAGINLIESGLQPAQTLYITNTSGVNCKLKIYDLANTNLLVSYTNVVCCKQAVIGQPELSTNITNTQAYSIRSIILTNNSFITYKRGFYLHGLIISNSTALSISVVNQ